MISAILRAQWLSMRGFRLAARRRGALFSILTGLIWYGLWGFLAFAAEEFLAASEDAPGLHTGLRNALMLIFLYWQLAPLVLASLGASLDLKKLLVYPIPLAKLFFIEVLLRLTTCAEMLLLLAGGFIGLLRNPSHGGMVHAPRLFASFLLFTAFNLLMASGMRNLLERLLTHKRLREILIVLFVSVAALPQLLLATKAPVGSWWRSITESAGVFWPWTALARIALGDALASPFAALAAWTAAALLFGRWQFARSLRYDAQSTGSRAAAPRDLAPSRLESFYRLPGLFFPDPLAALIEKELRALSRTPRFRTVFVMGFSFGLIVWLPITLGGRQAGSVVADHFLTVVSVYALSLLGQVSYMNAFGFDRSAVQIYFSVPVPIARAFAAKNIAAALFILVDMVAVTLACLLFRIHLSPGTIAEAFLVTGIVGLYLLAVGNLSSVSFPRAMNPERVSQGGAAGRMQALIFILYPLALLPVFLAFWARYVFASELMFYLILSFAAILGAVVYWIAMESAVNSALDRRENLLMELSRNDGPVAAE